MDSINDTPVSGFASFNLSDATMKAMNEMGFTNPTPIQEQALPILLGDSNDFIGLASTGTGKTAAFGIPLIERIDAENKNTQALVLSPTRELALQVSDQLQKLGKFKNIRVVTIYGGASYNTQISGIKRGAHIVVATPGRLVDFLDQKMIKLQHVQTVVLDEADEMISMGFKDDLETILKATHSEDTDSNRASCKTWLFSATMSSDIRRVANTYLESPEIVQINKSSGLSETVEQVYYTVKNSNKTEVIGRLLQVHPDFYGIIFCQTKVEVVELSDALNRRGFASEALHGDRSQKEREMTLRKFRNRELQVVVATDVAARGLDIKDLTHVINHSLPWDTESYIHRIGRTGRNGQKGVAISLINPEQLRSLKRIQMQTRVNMTKGTVPTSQDVAMMKIKEVVKKIQAVDEASKEFALATEYIAESMEQLAELSKEQILARMIVADYPQVFVKGDAFLDFVGDRVPRELMAGGGHSRPPIGSRSGGDYEGRPRRDGGGPRRDRGGGDRRDRSDRGDRGGERRDFRSSDRPERSDRGGERREFRPSSDRPERSGERSERPRFFERVRKENDGEGSARRSSDRSERSDRGGARKSDIPGVKRHRSSDKKRSYRD